MLCYPSPDLPAAQPEANERTVATALPELPTSPPPPAPLPGPPRWTGRDSWALLLALAALYALAGRGTFYSSDEGGIFNTGLALLQRQALDIAPGENVHRGSDGRFYACREILPSLLCTPFALGGLLIRAAAPAVPAPVGSTAAQLVGGNWPSFVTATLLGPLLIAGTLLMLVLFAQEEGVEPGDALGLALVAGLGTPLAFYARTIFPQAFESLWLMAALLAAIRWRRGGDARAALAVGAACGLGVMTRGAFVLPAAALGLYLMAARPQTWAERLRTGLVFALPVILGGLVTAWVNWRRWGNPFDFGYHNPYETFRTPPLAGLYGLLLSPGKGLFVFAPVLLLVLLFARRIWRAGRAEVLLVGAISLLYLALYCRWYDWPGGLAWGPRFLVPLTAPWVALLGRAFRLGPAGAAGLAWPRRLLLVTGVAGFLVQLPGLLLHPAHMGWNGGLDAPARSVAVPLVRTLLQAGPDDLWLGSPRGPGGTAVLVAAGVLGLVLLGAAATLWRRWRTPAVRYPLLVLVLLAAALLAARPLLAL